MWLIWAGRCRGSFFHVRGCVCISWESRLGVVDLGGQSDSCSCFVHHSLQISWGKAEGMALVRHYAPMICATYVSNMNRSF